MMILLLILEIIFVILFIGSVVLGINYERTWWESDNYHKAWAMYKAATLLATAIIITAMFLSHSLNHV